MLNWTREQREDSVRPELCVNARSRQERHRVRFAHEMLSFDEALARVLAGAERLGTETVTLGDALDRVLAETLVGDTHMPAFDYSAMDGYALACESLSGGLPWTLPVVGESRTGRVPEPLAPGSCMRIFTGAEVPAGADAVVLQEDVERHGDQARSNERPSPGKNIRRKGEDLAPGAIALEAGVRLGPAQLGLVAALDRGEIAVARRPRVSIVCTGDELRAPGSAARPGTIPNSNAVALEALVRLAGGAPRLALQAPDERAATTDAIARALIDTDVLVTVGGVSVGDHDVVRAALEAAGAELGFWKVRIKPGKPLVSGLAGNVRILGLPGNPASAFVTFALFGMPLLRALQGDRRCVPFTRRARLTEPLRQSPGRRGFYRARLDGERATPLSNQASGAPTSMAWADALVIVPEDSSGYERDAEVEVLALGDL